MQSARTSHRRELEKYCGTILFSDAFIRLNEITFLGILSPKYSNVNGFPWPRISGNDGSRMDHSLGVAHLIFKITERLKLNEQAKRYAIAWGLLHDIATWGLSHTGEAAFIKVLKKSARSLRQQMILGDQSLPDRYQLSRSVMESGLDPETLLLLFEKTPPKLPEDLFAVWQLIHSPLTPDTLEGISRAGRIYGFEMADPFEFVNAFQKSMFGVEFRKDYSVLAFEFWRQKSRIYNSYINSPDAIHWESKWAHSLQQYYCNLSFSESLDLSEGEMVERTATDGLIDTSGVIRYKKPLEYKIKGNQQRLPNDFFLDQLGLYFTKA